MANYPETRDWVDVWKATENISVPTESASVWNPITFTIQEPGGNYNSFGTMSAIKQYDGTQTQYWWGYSTQVNVSVAPSAGNTF